MQKKPTSVPQFGGWDQKAPGAATDYSMVFTKARATKKQQKTDLTEVKRGSLGNERELLNNNHARVNAHAYAHHVNAHHAQDDTVVMVRPFSLLPISPA